MLGSVERCTAVLTEHFLGKYPFWLSPRQAIVIPIHLDKGVPEYCKQVAQRLMDAGFYAEAEVSTKKPNKKIVLARKAMWNYMLVCGDKEMENDSVDIRTRDDKRIGTMSVDELLLWFLDLKRSKSKEGAGSLSKLMAKMEEQKKAAEAEEAAKQAAKDAKAAAKAKAKEEAAAAKAAAGNE